jgi:hypothetical protein
MTPTHLDSQPPSRLLSGGWQQHVDRLGALYRILIIASGSPMLMHLIDCRCHHDHVSQTSSECPLSCVDLLVVDVRRHLNHLPSNLATQIYSDLEFWWCVSTTIRNNQSFAEVNHYVRHEALRSIVLTASPSHSSWLLTPAHVLSGGGFKIVVTRNYNS